MIDENEMKERKKVSLDDNFGAGPSLLGGGGGGGGGPIKKMEIEENDYESLLRYRARLPQVRPSLPPKTTLAAIVMLVLGSTFLLIGTSYYWAHFRDMDGDKGLAMIVLGALMFIPGSYASVVLFGAWRGWRGYQYSQVPSYDEEH